MYKYTKIKVKQLKWKIAECIINVIKYLLELGFLICICLLWKLSSNNAFESHLIGNLTNYFYFVSDSTISINNEFKCDNTLSENFNKEQSISHKYDKISEDNKIEYNPLFKRKLGSRSFCNDMLSSFERNKGRKLSYIFDLNYNIVRGLSIAILSISASNDILLFVIFILLIVADYHKEKKMSTKCEEKCLIVCDLILALFWIGKFVLSLLLYHFIESGDIGKYNEFLDCSNVKKYYFKNFDDIEKFRKVFLAFAINSIISESLDKLKDVLEIIQNALKKKEKATTPTVATIIPK